MISQYLPEIFDATRVDRTMDIGQEEAEECTRALSRMEGIFCGVSSGGAISAALRLSEEVENSTIVAIVCDRGDRYLSTGVYSQPDTPLPTDVQVCGSCVCERRISSTCGWWCWAS
jgi:cysteine synthase B